MASQTLGRFFEALPPGRSLLRAPFVFAAAILSFFRGDGGNRTRVLLTSGYSSTSLGFTNHGTTKAGSLGLLLQPSLLCSTYLKPDCPARTTALSGA